MEDHRRAPSENAANGIDDLLAKGWAATTRISRADTTSGADRYFSEVLARDPDNVSALIGLGAFHVVGAAMFLETGQTFDLAMAEQLLTRALALQPRASMAYYYLGVLHKVRGRPDAALSAFRQTLEINPSYAPAYAQVGHVLSRTGHLNTALEHVRYAIRLSPRDHNIGLWSLFGGQIELEQGHTKAAIAWMLRAADAAPRSPYVHAALAAAYALVGDRESQSRHVAETRRLAPSLNVDQMVLRLIGQSTGGGEPQRLIDGLRKAFVSEG
jgi:tetratricopeptide (TPR) repeat protein